MNGERLSAWTADDVLQKAQVTQEMAFAMNIRKNIGSGSAESPGNKQLLSRLEGASIVLSNYLGRVQTLLERNLVDRDLTVRSLGYLAVKVWPLADEIVPEHVDTEAYKDFVETAKADIAAAQRTQSLEAESKTWRNGKSDPLGCD
jgi:hypothetical protein